MADEPSFVVTVDWAASMATVAIPGELDSSTCELLTERLAWILESHPQRLVLDLAGVDDRFSEQALALIAAARLQLPRDSLLSVRSASTAVRRDLELAGWRGVRVSGAPADVSPPGPGPMDGIAGGELTAIRLQHPVWRIQTGNGTRR